eukprot:CAMPEP_0204904886 /NCGR_PEP_ID=MMETSP1397-20131031/5112_1 /ASSEMBLY_ACC=CAM_ASM_000891 /TAXON_ID=49980 /ORGANISM="Climacostomum Climacostomum virens, Strain Stock W-24" /LENGTH=222 /DNA_ID=CAMNT_0052073711 /DNA_START=129 /DNA_END=797 /DNA_ORIENTATION=+
MISSPLPEHFHGNPYEHLANEITLKFLDKVHQPTVEGCVVMVEKDGIKVLAKDTPDGIFMWSEYRIPFRPQQVLSFISKLERRKLWDSNIQDVRKVVQVNSSTYVSYTVYKGFLTVKSRDLVLLSTQGKDGESYYEASASVDIDEYPASNAHVRARMLIGGFFIIPVQVEGGAEHSRILNFSESNIGGSMPMSFIKKMSASAIPKYVQSLSNALAKEAAQSS